MRFLVGVDGSDRSLEALAETIENAGDDDEIAVAVYAEDGDPADVEQRVTDLLATVDTPATVRRLTGDPGSQLVELAEQEAYDRIVLAGGYRSPLGKIQLDSVVEFTLLNARTSVTLIR
ncbi:MAG: universal stress protein [Halovenus sp.]